jgi:peptidoglycan/xylan/chitin deacetylase (PgdA/CDA1 family)
MQVLSVVIATARAGRKLEALLRRARALSAAAGAPSVVVAYGQRRALPDRADWGDAQLLVDSAGDGVGSALLAGARHAQAARCLLLDELSLDEALVRAHRRVPSGAELVTVGRVSLGWAGGREPPRAWDPLYAFAIQGARNACVPRASLLELAGREALEDPVHAHRLAHRLRARGIVFARVEDAAAAQRADGARARVLGRAAGTLYREDPTTLPDSGLGGFKRGSLRRVMLRRTLAPLPGAARTVGALARTVPAPRLRATLLDVSADAHFWSGVRGAVSRDTWRRIKSQAAILVYHAFAPDGEQGSQYVLPARKLGRQLAVLRALRRHVMPLASYVSLREAHALPPAGTVVITIDDGYEDVYEVAAPIMSAHGCSAIVFVVSGHVGRPAEWTADQSLHSRRLASWQQLRDGLAAGLDVGAHSRTHPRLTQLSDEAAAEEIEGSRRELAQGLRRPVAFFAYPHGDRDSRTERLVRRAGFAAACSTQGGKNGPCEPLESLRRMEIRGDQGVLRFVLTVMLGRRSLRSVRRGNGKD